MIATKPRLLTGDTPSGKLHLGHWVGSLENRVGLQDEYDCYFLLANAHAYTTKSEQPKQIKQNTLDIALDYLAAGIDPSKSTIFIETEVPAIFELATYVSMLVPLPRLMRNPTLKEEIRTKQLGDNYSVGFTNYPILQVADILAFQAHIVPVGEDQVPLIEMAREVARRFNQLYFGVSPHTSDQDYVNQGGLFPIVDAKMGRAKRLVGLGAPDSDGRLIKMSKSLNNSILLSDDNDAIRKKVMGMYTDPKRLKATDPGSIENNPLWVFHDVFNHDKEWVEDTKQRYQAGTIGDVDCKKKLIEVIIELLEPMQQRRKQYANDPGEILNILQKGSEKARQVTSQTLTQLKEHMQLDFSKVLQPHA